MLLRPLTLFSVMRLGLPICLSVVSGLLASCCCVEVDVITTVRAGQQTGETGQQTLQDGTRSLQPIIHSNPLPVILRHQEGYSSCWAACAEMIIEYLGGGRIRQCQQASAVFGIPASTCCSGDGVLEPASACDKQHWPEFTTWGFRCDFRSESENPALSWGEIMREIDAGQPFVFSWEENETPLYTHFMVVVGYHEAEGDQLVTYLDPLFESPHDPAQIPLDRYNGRDLVHRHIDDYFGIRPISGP